MASQTNLLVKDDAATPKEWTFEPITDTPIPLWRGSDPAIPLEGLPRFSCSSEKQKNGDYKITAKLELPVMETLGASGTSAGYVAPPKVAYTNVGIFTMFAPGRATQADRSNVLKMMVGLLQGASATTATGILANTAAGSAWGNSVLPIPLLYTKVIVPN
jgi:hypothetical protein